MASSSITSWQMWEKMENKISAFYFLGSEITADGDCSHEIKTFAPWKNRYGKPRQCIIKQKHHSVNKSPYSQSYGFSSSHVWM